MRVKLEGNRIYTVFHLNMMVNVQVVARDNAHARSIVNSKLKHAIDPKCGYACKWNIYNADRGITKLPLGSIIYTDRI